MARVGIIGTGWGARVQVPAFREAGLDVAAIAGRDARKTEEIGRELAVPAVANWRALVASNEVDLVSIVTPPSLHLAMATAALDAGKHVLCEKPTALNAAEAEELLRAAQRHPDRIALIDHELRFVPAWQSAREAMARLGGIRFAEVRYVSPSRGDRNRAWNWWSDAGEGGGVWGAVGSHFVDALRHLIGEIESIQAMLATIIAERPFQEETRPVTSDDFAAIHARLRGGALAVMTFTGVAGGPDEPTLLTIHGERGALRLAGEELLFAQRGEPLVRIAGDELSKRPGNSPGGAFGTGTYELGRALKRALDDGDRAALVHAATFEDGLAQQRVIDAARESARTGCWERVR